jgi:hypothetical protein
VLHDVDTPASLLTALALAQEHEGATRALTMTGLDLDDIERFDGIPEGLGRLLAGRTNGEAIAEALALGFLAGRVAHRPRPRRSLDPTSFLMDHDLLVRHAEGQSILRLPWFEEDLFVARSLPEISEMPAPVRHLCIANYRAGLAGETGSFSFTSYGHAYRVRTNPVRGEDGSIQAVLSIATPSPPSGGQLRAAAAFDRAAAALEQSARLGEERAEIYRTMGQPAAEERERVAAAKAWASARRARANAFRQRAES